MAGSGLLLVGFVIAHMLGNLTFFLGPDAMNAYARLIKSNMELLWVLRLGLLGALVAHVWSAIALLKVSKSARPVGYRQVTPQASTFASRTMRIGGLVLLFFVIFHLLHFTAGAIEPAPFSETNVFGNVVGGFSVPWVAALYIVAMVALGLHLFHGVWAAFRTLGVARPSPTPMKRRLAVVVAGVVWLGFTVIPVAVVTGLVK